MPPRAISGTPSPRIINPSLTTPSAGAPGCERVANIGETNSASAPARIAVSASRREWAGAVRNFARPWRSPWTPMPGETRHGRATTSISRRRRAMRSIRANSAFRSARGSE